MYDINEFVALLEKFAPLELSQKMIDLGCYDNSGLLIKCNDKVSKVLFSLDLSKETVKKAKRLKCDTIVTHHPAIYGGLKELSFDGQSAEIVDAVKSNINVISFHLNLDIAETGIDNKLALGLGASKYQILNYATDKHGYGRQFEVKDKTFGEFILDAKKTFGTNKIVAYGNKKQKIYTVASFCGGGASDVEKLICKNGLLSDVVVTSDMPHHVIKLLIENGKKILLLPHYASENFGFKCFYDWVKEKLNGQIETEYFLDKRFM